MKMKTTFPDTEGEYKVAFSHYRKEVKCHPQDAEAHAELALALLGQIYFGGLPVAQQTAKAKPHIKKAIELDPELSTAYVARGLLKRYQNEPAKAEKDFKKAITLKPKDERVHLFYGNLLNWVLMDPEGAVDQFRKAIILSPSNLGAQQQLAEALMNLGRQESAKLILMGLVQVNPDFADAHRNLGMLYNRYLYQHHLAIEAYGKAIKLDAANPRLAAYMGDSYFDIGLRDQAKEWYQRAFELTPSGPAGSKGQVAIWSQARIHEIDGNQNGKLAELEKLQVGHDMFMKAIVELGIDDLKTRNKAAALQRYAKAFPQLTGHHPEVNQANLGPAIAYVCTLILAGELQSALPLVALIVSILPLVPRSGRGGIEIWDAWLYLSLGDEERALAALTAWRDAGGTRSLVDEISLEPLFGNSVFRDIQHEIEVELAEQQKLLGGGGKRPPSGSGPNLPGRVVIIQRTYRSVVDIVPVTSG